MRWPNATAERDGEGAPETRRRLMMWAEFTWRTGAGEYGLDRLLREVPIAGMAGFFGRSAWRAEDLLTLGNPPLRRYVHDVAFGSLLRAVEDSFAKGHVGRVEGVAGATCPDTDRLPRPGRVREFLPTSGRTAAGTATTTAPRRSRRTCWRSGRTRSRSAGHCAS